MGHIRQSARSTSARFFFIIVLTLTYVPLRAAFAQEAVEVLESQTTYSFGDRLTFQARFQSSSPIKSVYVLFDAQGETHTEPVPATINPDGSVVCEVDLAANPLRPFSEVRYRYHLTLSDGRTVTTPTYTFAYTDNRFTWQELNEGAFTVSWYQGDINMAQSALDVAQSGFVHVKSILNGSTVDEPIHFYIYASARDLQGVLEPSGGNLYAGHADPELDVALINLPPGPDQQNQMEQRIPHELMHIMLYRATKDGYKNLPVWLNEGLASVVELYPNPDYQVLLDNAYQADNLLPVASLCEGFPRDASNTILAYAESASFTRYLYETYGVKGINGLMTNYANGLACQPGLQKALGTTIAQAEREWRGAVFSENHVEKSLASLAPWFVVLIAVLAGPIGFTLSLSRRKRSTQAEAAILAHNEL